MFTRIVNVMKCQFNGIYNNLANDTNG